mmetsp:Transcript_48115/g.87014  ORF Transcript_48115/g.87014 Transcript_48115/m.87014 type:complete len:394 (-) Transcript_48115:133-1314(-)
MQLALISAFAFAAISADGNTSPCGTEVCPGSLFVDEVSLLQRSDEVKRWKSKFSNHVKFEAHHISGVVWGNQKLEENLVYVRVPKTGSTSMSSAVMRIAAHHNLSGVFAPPRTWPTENGEPGVWTDHGALDADDFGENLAVEKIHEKDANETADDLPSTSAIQALKKPVFPLTMVRDPASRSMSRFYYAQCMGTTSEPNTSTKVWYLSGYSNNEFRYIRMSAQTTIDDLFKFYGLIGVTERLDESLVVLAATLKVPLSDVLYLNGKSSSEGYAYRKDSVNLQHCSSHPTLSQEPQDVQRYVEGPFRQANDLDHQLVQRANQVLDAKIAEMNLEPAIAKFKELLAQAQQVCKVPGTDQHPIQELVECYQKDVGCNYKCLDQFALSVREPCAWCV